MITSFLFWVGGSTLGKWVAIVAIASITVGSAWGGYRLCELKWESRELATMQAWAEKLKEDDEFTREIEREALMSETATEVQIETVVKEITKYITSDDCSNINPAGVQHIRKEITNVFGKAK